MQIQKFIIKAIFLLAVTMPLVITGCDKTDDEVPVINNTIAGLILKDTAFSTMEALVSKASLAVTLNGTGPFTVFAPDNAAFAASGLTPTIINNLGQAQAQTILLYHMLNSKIMAADLPGGPNASVVTASGDSFFVTKNAAGVHINGVKVAQTDIAADNGIIHKIQRVLNPPPGSIEQTAIANGLDSLAKVISRVINDSTGDAGLDSVLNTATLTVFSPTDSAFIDLLTALSYIDINDIPVDSLATILKYHIVPGRYFSPDFTDGSLTMLAGDTTSFNLTNGIGGGPTITGTNNGGNASNIISTNIMSRNAVLHQIDRVLIP